MRLIDADELIENIKYSSHDYERVRIDTVTGCLLTDSISPTIDPIHAAGGCYCRQCFHSELNFMPDDTYWCNRCNCIMSLNGFCSEGRKDDTKNV